MHFIVGYSPRAHVIALGPEIVDRSQHTAWITASAHSNAAAVTLLGMSPSSLLLPDLNVRQAFLCTLREGPGSVTSRTWSRIDWLGSSDDSADGRPVSGTVGLRRQVPVLWCLQRGGGRGTKLKDLEGRESWNA